MEGAIVPAAPTNSEPPKKAVPKSSGKVPKKSQNFGDWSKYGPKEFQSSEWAVVSVPKPAD
jgi:hypothetical protein